MALPDNWTVDFDMLSHEIKDFVRKKDNIADTEFAEPEIISMYDRKIYKTAKKIVELYEKHNNEAQARLDKLVSKINGKDRTDRAKLIEVAARVRSIGEDVRMSENSNDNYGYYCQLCDAADDIEIIADED